MKIKNSEITAMDGKITLREKRSIERIDKKIQITPDIKISELLNNYPELEGKLIELSPAFKKLRNPILKRTIAKVTSLKQAATIGQVPLATLINTLRKEAGLEQLEIKNEISAKTEKPVWVKNENVVVTYDATLDIENGAHPISKVTKDIMQLNNNEIYLLITPFLPEPLIDLIKGKGFEVYSEKEDENYINTFIKKTK